MLYKWRRTVQKSGLRSGMNFAFGGNRVFDAFMIHQCNKYGFPNWFLSAVALRKSLNQTRP
ncbi:hypothetical protein NC652_020232 [Populus alba x Populus x berolinensis]|uniref:Uncharacterized protein n=1 Tax=Populus alba x Populus x berolinensis TaxID=444605 RepID=A0AAD6QBW4_9ROSI|nr:hypothetical protein NC652_020192 [Populus alba x Populus x berolinensis]KAJ6909191.1 hypothetical protein NC652_020232 [Populus alba x Populus x berolinensis]KAJ6986650.1 hypothetical protein NC653_020007 [Populus alba x Populus x berolinensis]KAJ6986694.1 hypothetical protein NC653_020043 [Populus alba x Populus x berolinensis]